MIIAITGKISSGKSYISQAIFEKFQKKYDCELIDLDKFCKQLLMCPNQVEWLESLFDVPIPYDNPTNFSSFIFENVFCRLDYYTKWCSFYENSLENKVSQAFNKPIITFVEASALYSYPSLLKYCDHIIEVQADDADRLSAFHNRTGLARSICLDRMRNLDTIFEQMKGRAKTIHVKNPALTIYNTFYDSRSSIQNACKDIEQLIVSPVSQSVDLNVDSKRQKTVALFCGSFNPFTIGHKSIYDKAQKLFDIVLVVRAQNPTKEHSEFECSLADFSTDYVPAIIEHVKVLFPDYEIVLVRGIRNSADLDDADRWHNSIELCLGERIELVLLKADPQFANLSSSFVRELYKLDAVKAETFFIK